MRRFLNPFIGVYWLVIIANGSANAQDKPREALLMLYVGTHTSDQVAEEAWELAVAQKDLFLPCANNHLATLLRNIRASSDFSIVADEIDAATTNIAKATAEDGEAAKEVLPEMDREVSSEKSALYDGLAYSINQIIFLKSVLGRIDSTGGDYQAWATSVVAQTLAEQRAALSEQLGDRAAGFFEFAAKEAAQDYPFLLCLDEGV
jgi:hypothetical protein